MTKVEAAVKRITEMEEALQEAKKSADALEKAMDDFEACQKKIRKLEKYYASQNWKNDLALDEGGKLPKELKRGVLSEDGIYNLLEQNKELLERMGR
ncbi:MAG: DUF4298 domain-containing protein [Lachnospiraceae bacterium]|nr:DUF4298 domain-containing protein [Lachnospiraceae bacterium]